MISGRTISLAAALLFLSGCGTLNTALTHVFPSDAEKEKEKEVWWCNSGSPQEMGKRSALQDESREGGLLRYQQVCQKHGIVVNSTAWQQGYDEGDKRYCSYQNAYNIGLSNESYHLPRCDDKTPRQRKNLKEAYDMGREYYSLRWAANMSSESMTREAEQISKLQAQRADAEYGSGKMTYSDTLQNSKYEAAYRRSYAESAGRLATEMSKLETAEQQHRIRLAQMENEK